MGYLDNAGLAHLWGKVRAALNKCVKLGTNTLNAPLEFKQAASDGYIVVTNRQQHTIISSGVINTNSITLGKEPTAPSSAATKKYVDDSVSSAVPSGVIVMWSGAATAIPTGWVLCNGQNGTPDLRNRFVVGAGSTYTVGAMGGEATHKLTFTEMPAHTHFLKTKYGVGFSVAPNGIGSPIVSMSGDTENDSTASTGGTSAHNNLPPYYALCYIMKR